MTLLRFDLSYPVATRLFRRSPAAARIAALLLSLAPAAHAGLAEPPAHSGSRPSYTLEGKVVRVSDGDTFTLLSRGAQRRIRMASIDAPEIGKDAGQPGQPFGRASRSALAALIAGKTLRVDCYEQDQYDRDICDVPLPGGMSANQKQVAAGMAWANMQGRGKYMRDSSLPGLQQRASRERKGLWQDAHAVQPWVWRYRCWRQQQC